MPVTIQKSKNIINFQIQSSKEINKVNEDPLIITMALENGAFSHYGAFVVSIQEADANILTGVTDGLHILKGKTCGLHIWRRLRIF
jgi:hypothetical protein